VPEGWRPAVVAYLVWLIAFTVVEGLGRQTCRLPTARWIAAATDARDRTMREDFRARANVCLDATAWYTSAIRALVIAALLLPLATLRLVRWRSELVRNVTIAAGIGGMLASIAAVRWLYDWLA
jgi:hypothetical protein